MFFRTCLASLLITVAAGSPAFAQVQESTNFPVERLRISLNREGIIDVEWARVLPHLSWDAGLWIGYAKNPLVVGDLELRRDIASLVSDRLGASLFGTLGLFEWIEIGLELPVILYQTRPTSQPQAFTADLSGLAAAGFGDIRLSPKLRLLRSDQYFVDLAILLAVTFPSGAERQYLGEPTVTFKPEILLSRDLRSTAAKGLRLAVNLGLDVRGRTRSVSQDVESELTYRVGAAYRLKEHELAPFEIDLSLSGTTSLLKPFQRFNQSALEARLMGAYEIYDMWQVFAGAGVGLLAGWGTPDFRVFAGVRVGFPYEREKPASVPASVPASAPASKPVETLPPLEAPKRVVPDTDGDGLKDDVDNCPNDREDKDGFKDEDGCPDPDNDQDGVTDLFDLCVNVPGVLENRGCPDKDTDNDTVIDRFDNCPNEPGTPENQGCAAKQLVLIKSGKLEILDAVFFDTGKDTIKPVSFALLDNVAQVIAAHPEVAKVRVEGHTDNVGQPAKNLDLSQRRAESVVRYLIGKGIAAERLMAKGFGQDKPIAPNSSERGKAKNRRVEFVIVSETE